MAPCPQFPPSLSCQGVQDITIRVPTFCSKGLLKNKIQCNKCEDLIGFIQHFMNWAVSSVRRGCTKWRVFTEGGRGEKVVIKRKERIVSGQVTFFWGKSKSLLFILPLLPLGDRKGLH